MELAVNAETVELHTLKCDSVELEIKTRNVLLDDVTGAVEINCNLDMNVVCCSLKGEIALNQIAAAVLSRSGNGSGISPMLMLLGLLAPAVTAVVTVAASDSAALKQDLKRKLVGFYRIRPLSIFAAVTGFMVIVALSILRSTLFGQSLDQFAFTDGFSFSVGGTSALLTILFAATIEEVGAGLPLCFYPCFFHKLLYNRQGEERDLMNHITCRKCGRELPPDAGFCTYCGTAVTEGAAVPKAPKGDGNVSVPGAAMPQPPRRSRKALMACGGGAAALLLALALILSFGGRTPSGAGPAPVSPPPSIPPASPAGAAAEEPDTAPWTNHVLKNEIPDSFILAASEYPVFGSEYTRDQIVSVTFLDTLEGQSGGAWDASRAGDGSVMAWVKPNGALFDLYIAGEGGVAAPEDCTFLFGKYSNVQSVRIGGALHTENTTSMYEMFLNCTALTTLDVDGFDTAQVTDMRMMFSGCRALTELHVGGWDTSRAENMGFMFNACYGLKSLDPGGWNTSRVTDMMNMFAFCQGLTALDLSGWDTSAVTDMSAMFFNCRELRSLKTGGWTTAAGTEGMFDGCEKLDAAAISALLAGGAHSEGPGTSGGSPTSAPSPESTPKPTAKPASTPQPTAKPASTPKPTAKPSSGSAAAVSGATLPDPSEFLHGKLKHRERDISGGLEIHFYFDKTSKSAAYEYADLLSGKSVDLTLRQKYDDSKNGLVSTYYVYDYTGSGSVDSISQTTTQQHQNFEAPVIVNVVEFGGSGVSSNWLYLTIYCSNDFSFADSGDRSTDSVFEDFYNTYDPDTAFLGPVGSGFKANGSSGGSSSEYEYDISAPGSVGNRIDCSVCGGDGKRDCMVCGGDGKVKHYKPGGGVYGVGGGEWVVEDCSTCNGRGWRNCTACGGDGKI